MGQGKGTASKICSINLHKMQQTKCGKTPKAVGVCAYFTMILSKEETRQTVKSNALCFLQAVLPEEPGLLHRGGDEGGDCQRMRGEGRGARSM